MSESGKVSLPTPERIEEIKEDAAHEISEGYGYDISDITYEEALGLLAALEESQQQVKDLKEDKRKILAVHDEQCARSSEYYNELIFVKRKLKEEEQEKIKYKEESERLNEICRQLAGEEMMFQEGQYETEMQRLEAKLVEEQQTIARQREVLESARNTMEDALSVGEARYKDFDTRLCPWADLSDGVENIEAALGNKEGSDKA
ncbi:hypothetical protein [Paenibacillus sp. FSL L8-0708]|uniref:hypothetical protein n=1 Tax=Paenibacillus sp. FSL L8-0708 TaxID=2975311 RepID=UPI0030F7508B